MPVKTMGYECRMFEAILLTKRFDSAYEAAGHLDDLINVHGFEASIMLDHLDGYVVLACDKTKGYTK